MKGILYFDGSAEPTNPGYAVASAVVDLENGNRHYYTQYLGKGSCNTAEYGGLILGCVKAAELGIKDVVIYGDSQLVVNCVNGSWNSKQAHLTLHIQQARLLLSRFTSWELTWIRRDGNLADKYSRISSAPKYGTILDLSLAA